MQPAGGRRPNPWLTIWTSPRATMRAILDTDPKRMVIMLALIGGFAQVLDNAAYCSVGDRLSILQIILVSAVVGPVAGAIALYGAGGLLTWTGRWLKGQGSFIHVRAAIGWSNAPVIWSLLLWIPELLLFGNEMFASKTPRLDNNLFLAVTFLVFVLIELIVTIWSFVIFIKCLAEAQRFSAWKALANILMTAFIIAVPVFVIALIV